MKLRATFFWLMLCLCAGLVWGCTDEQEELTVYSAKCADTKTQILPPSLVEDYDKYWADRRNCVILPLGRTVYRINMARAEVTYMLLGMPFKLVDCAIFSRTDWSCSYPDDSGEIVILDGLQAIHDDDVELKKAFYLRRWQWWAARLYWFVGGRPSGAWLIPEQKREWG